MSATNTWKIIAWLMALSVSLSLLGSGVHSASAQSHCDWAKFIADVTVPDGTSFNGSTPFTKTWRLKNIGSCTWTTAYALVFSSGEQMAGPLTVNLPYN